MVESGSVEPDLSDSGSEFYTPIQPTPIMGMHSAPAALQAERLEVSLR